MQIDLTRSEESKSASVRRLSRELLVKLLFVACVAAILTPTRLWIAAWSRFSGAAPIVVMSVALIGLAMALIKSSRRRSQLST